MTGEDDMYLHDENIPVPQVEDRTHPGEMLREMYLDEMGLSPEAFARHLGVDTDIITALCIGAGSVTYELAVRLGRALGTGTQFWLNVQHNYDDSQELKRLRATGAIKSAEAVPALIGD